MRLSSSTEGTGKGEVNLDRARDGGLRVPLGQGKGSTPDRPGLRYDRARDRRERQERFTSTRGTARTSGKRRPPLEGHFDRSRGRRRGLPRQRDDTEDPRGSARTRQGGFTRRLA